MRISMMILAISGLVLAVGCGPAAPDRPATVEVAGKVTLNGNPVEGATVAFSPDGEGHAASGTTDASGAYSLTSFVAGDGAVEGSYSVKITKISGGEDNIPATTEDNPDAAYEALMQGGGAEESKNELPAKYADTKTSGFTTTVPGGTYDFDMTE